MRLIDYLHADWPEHDLSGDRLAPAHQISTRQLHQLLDARDVTLGD